MASIQSRAEPEQMWQCGRCDELHDDEYAAHECCSQVCEVWICPTCGKDHDTRNDALICADRDADAGVVVLPTPLELEAAGQLRLLP